MAATKDVQVGPWGGPGGNNDFTFKPDGKIIKILMYIEPGEHIIELSGTVGTYRNITLITSLCFKTNKKSCVFGFASGEKFSLPVKPNTANFVGFHGRSGNYLDAIGAILVPK